MNTAVLSLFIFLAASPQLRAKNLPADAATPKGNPGQQAANPASDAAPSNPGQQVSDPAGAGKGQPPAETPSGTQPAQPANPGETPAEPAQPGDKVQPDGADKENPADADKNPGDKEDKDAKDKKDKKDKDAKDKKDKPGKGGKSGGGSGLSAPSGAPSPAAAGIAGGGLIGGLLAGDKKEEAKEEEKKTEPETKASSEPVKAQETVQKSTAAAAEPLYSAGKGPRIAVIALDGEAGPEFAALLSGALSADLKVYNPKELAAKAYDAAAVNRVSARKMAADLAVDYVVTGKVNKKSETLSIISLYLREAKSGDIKLTDNHNIRSAEDLLPAAADAARKIAERTKE